MSKRVRSLSAALGPAEPEPQVEAAPAPAPEPARSKPVGVMLYVSQEDHERLRDLSHATRTSLQKLGVEAWSLLLEKRGLPPLTPTPASTPSGRRRG